MEKGGTHASVPFPGILQILHQLDTVHAALVCEGLEFHWLKGLIN